MRGLAVRKVVGLEVQGGQVGEVHQGWGKHCGSCRPQRAGAEVQQLQAVGTDQGGADVASACSRKKERKTTPVGVSEGRSVVCRLVPAQAGKAGRERPRQEWPPAKRSCVMSYCRQ